MTTLHYAGTPGEGFGWGICNANLKRELGKFFTLTDGPADLCFVPLADHDLNPCSDARGTVNVAYTFFEYELGPNAAENAALYDVVFCGSTWCLDRMKECGITNGKVLLQGVDQSIFKLTEKPKSERFNIFSGGKFEWRKGQDLVIAAFRDFSRRHPEAHLVCNWWNPWFNQLVGTMCQSTHIKIFGVAGRTQEDFYSNLLIANGIQPDRFSILHGIPQRWLAEYMSLTDVGLFPNRCEGGTNLVLMEYASIGRPVVANTLTGHRDVAAAISHQIAAAEDEKSHWANQSVGDIVDALEKAYQNRQPNPRQVWTWEDAAKTVVSAVI